MTPSASQLPPVFLIPLGRSGGTLFVTMLDSHRDLAMSYEIYEDRLVGDEGKPLLPATVISWLEASASRGGDDVQWIKSLPDRQIQVFLYRARRAGLTVENVLGELRAFAASGGVLDNLHGRLDLIERLMVCKMRKEGKRCWGGKAKADPRELHRRHPEARFCAMIRDGRDVLASMTRTGNFDADPMNVARQWVEHVEGFRAFAALDGALAMQIRYEQLVEDPETVMRGVCEFIGVEFDPDILRFDRKDLPLYRNPHGHLSHKQIRLGLNDQSIGRWKRDLTASQVEAFMRVAGETMRSLRYDVSAAAPSSTDAAVR